MSKYDDIIALEHPTSKRHPRMSLENRAAQFSPFAALTGYDQIIIESGRVVDEKIDIDEYQIAEINATLNYLKENLNTKVEIIHFVKDDKKIGGTYLKEEISIKKVDEDNHLIITSSGNTIIIDDIYSINII